MNSNGREEGKGRKTEGRGRRAEGRGQEARGVRVGRGQSGGGNPWFPVCRWRLHVRPSPRRVIALLYITLEDGQVEIEEGRKLKAEARKRTAEGKKQALNPEIGQIRETNLELGF